MSIEEAVADSLSLSLIIKCASFVVSILTVRISSVSDYGKLTVNFQLVISLSLFVLKEGFRRAALKASNIDSGKAVMVLGTFVTSLIIIPAVSLTYFTFFNKVDEFWLILIFILSLELESYAEIIFFHHAVVHRNLTIRNRTESWSGLVRAITLLCVLIWSNGNSTVAFSVSQLISSVILIYVSLKDGFPHNSFTCSLRSLRLELRPLLEMIVMSVEKFFLAEGERILTIYFLTSEEVGLLAVVTNLGSLVLRLVFAPLEDIAFTAFSAKKSDSIRILRSMLLIETLVGVLALSFGPTCADSFLTVLYGTKWNSAAPLLKIYSGMIIFFALNGCLEAFFFATCVSMKKTYLVQILSFLSLLISVWTLSSSIGPSSVLAGTWMSILIRIVWASTALRGRIREAIHPRMWNLCIRILIGGLLNWFILTLIGYQRPIFKLIVSTGVGVVTLGSLVPDVRRTVRDLRKVKS
jgi:oligosaccharide translocation protein RFT1